MSSFLTPFFWSSLNGQPPPTSKIPNPNSNLKPSGAHQKFITLISQHCKSLEFLIRHENLCKFFYVPLAVNFEFVGLHFNTRIVCNSVSNLIFLSCSLFYDFIKISLTISSRIFLKI